MKKQCNMSNVQAVFSDIGGYFEISVFKISRVDLLMYLFYSFRQGLFCDLIRESQCRYTDLHPWT